MKSIPTPLVLLIGVAVGAGGMAAFNAPKADATVSVVDAARSEVQAGHAERLDEVIKLIHAKKARTFDLSGSNDASLKGLEKVDSLRRISLNFSQTPTRVSSRSPT